MKRLLLPLVLSVLSLASSAHAQYPYEAVDLGEITPGGASVAYRINNYGQIVLTSAQQAALWQPIAPNSKYGSIQGLGTLGNPSGLGTDINDRGEITGTYKDSGNVNHVFIWQPTALNQATGAMHDIGVVTDSTFTGINNYGQIATGVGGKPALWTPSAPNGLSGSTDIFTAASYGNGYAINSSGQMTGSWGAGTYHPYLFTPSSPNTGTGTVVRADEVPGSFLLGTGGGGGINDSGAVVGGYFTGTASNPFLWSGSTMLNLAPTAIGGSADGINNAGYVVGTVSYVSNQDSAFLYSGGTLTNLNTLIDPSSNWILLRAFDINDHGQIVGYGVHNGQARGFLLAPASAPEPTTLGLLALGMLGKIAKCGRQKCT